MRDPSANSGAEIEETVPTPIQGGSSGNQLDKAGQSILRLLHKAAGVTEQKNRHTLEVAQKLAQQVRATESRLAELQAEVSKSVGSEPSVRSNGSTRSTAKLEIASCDERALHVVMSLVAAK